MKRRDSYIRGASMLAFGMFIGKVIGAIYRIPLTNILGAEGIGIYQLVFPVYALLITITSSGVPITLSRLIGEKRMSGQIEGTRALFLYSFRIFLFISVFAAALLFLAAPLIASLQNNTVVNIGYKLIAPAIILSTAIAAYRGWFQGNMNMFPSALSQIIENIVKLALGLYLASRLLPMGISYAVWGAIVSITVSELIALIIVWINYIIYNKKNFKLLNIDYDKKINAKGQLKELMNIAFPITLGSLMLPLTQFIDSMLIVNLLKNQGFQQELSTRMYGILTGPVGSLINMPVVLTLAFAVSAVPIISGSRANRDINGIRAKSIISVKLTFAIGVPSALAIYALAEPVMNVLYPNLTEGELSLAAGLLKVTSVSIILLSLMQIYSALLQATDRAYTPFINMSIGSIIKVILTIILIKYLNIYGAAIATIIAFVIVALLNIKSMAIWTGRYEILTKNISKILLSGVIMSILIILTVMLINADWIKLLAGTAIGIASYGILLVVLNIFPEEELEGMPFSSALIKISRLIKFWEKAYDNGSGSGKN